MSKQGFEDFLMMKHGEQYIGTDDDMPDAFVEWTNDISYDDWIEYGDQFAKKINAEYVKKSEEEILQIIYQHFPIYGIFPHPDKTPTEQEAIREKDKCKKKQLAKAIVQTIVEGEK